MRRTIALLLLLLVSLTACARGGGAPSAEEAAEARGPIRIWYSNNEFEIAWAQAVVEAWNADHADEQVTAEEIPAGDTSEEVIAASIAAGNTPCLIYNTSPAAVPQFQRQGGLVNLAEFEDGDSYVSERGGEVVEQYRSSDGGMYQLPWKSNPVMIFYNKELFSEAGIDAENPPLSTHAEFLETSRTLVESEASRAAIWPSPASQFFQSWFDFYPMFAAETGGTSLVADGEAQFNSPEGMAVADFWQTMYDEGLAPKEEATTDAFAEGDAAMAIAGPWAIAAYGDLDWGYVPVPTSSGVSPEETWTFSDAKSTAMYSSCQNRATAWDFLKFSTSEENDELLLSESGQMPMRTDVAGTYAEYLEENPAYELFAAQAERVVEVPNVTGSIEIWQTFRDTWSSAVIFGEGEHQSALEQAAEQIAEIAAEG